MHSYWTGFLLSSFLIVPALLSLWHESGRGAGEEALQAVRVPDILAKNALDISKRKGWTES